MEEGVRTVCWKPTWHERLADAGFEQCRVSPGRADAVVLAFDDDGAPFRLDHALLWNDRWPMRARPSP